MKQFSCLTGFLFLFMSANAQIINFPDANFKAKLIALGLDANNNQEIEQSEASAINYLDISSSNISDLTGIQYFTNVGTFLCGGNYLQSIDVSGMSSLGWFFCGQNQLTNITFGNLSSLTRVECAYNQLAALNLSGLPNLRQLGCKINQLTNLDVSMLTHLEILDCSQNQLTSLNVSALSNLKELYCNANQQLTSLNVGGLPNLQKLQCYTCNLQSLNVNGLINLIELGCDSNQLSSLDITGFSNLQTLSCGNNLLTSLDLTGLTQLISLNCNYNLIPSLNLTGLTNLEYLHCGQNPLSALSVNGLVKLKLIDFQSCQISSFDLTGLIFLNNFNCWNNQIATLDLSNKPNLKTLICDNNPISNLQVSLLPNLETLSCSGNLLTNLDVNQCTKLGTLYCNNNSQLTTLMAKNGKDESFFTFSGNPNLEYICADEGQVASIQSKILTYGYTSCHVNSYCSFTPGGTFYTISGNGRYDSDNNGCNGLDVNFPNLKLSFTDGVNSGSLIADHTGSYHYDVQQGTQNVTVSVENPTYFNLQPTNFSVSFPGASPFLQDFCITANGVYNDLEIAMLPIDIARPGFDSRYKIIYKNKGTQTQSGTISFVFNDAVLDFVNANPLVASQVINSLNWNFTNLLPFEIREITVTLNINSPSEVPPVNGGDGLIFTTTINSSLTDETPNDNTFVLNQTVVNSFDPNDKTCLEGNVITPEMIGKEVHYMIRFENTGTANAENIVVKDMIDTEKFDINSLIPIDGSHSFVTRISNTIKVEFIFENINLPFDDANNDGYVAFKIKTKPSLVLGDTFSNTASIYFDYNFPIITNNATTTVALLANQDFAFEQYFKIYPNPVKDILNIETKKTIEVTSVNIYNTLGQLVLVIPNAQQTKSMDVSSLKTGNYLMKINSDKESSSVKFIKL
ncbi:T9SS type A sorting domain-containing protein [Flavobacterium sp.]|uniref:T9SS type A sorting domain-containing protein n=1 Tax=Flavobacterium sp. TaxID=239 RepID=UPI00286C9D3F|nr:T9SS type A sorting domain-containing protein [Flavobacterium sp.]